MPKKKDTSTKNVAIRSTVHKQVKDLCEKKGYKVCFFVECAITQLLAVSSTSAAALSIRE